MFLIYGYLPTVVYLYSKDGIQTRLIYQYLDLHESSHVLLGEVHKLYWLCWLDYQWMYQQV